MSEKMTTSEPTTGEIVSALRNCPNCDDCLRKDQKCYRNDHDAADRLESQEQTISALTARAERAERERDAVIADLDALKDSGFCNSCVGCNAPHSESITYCTDWTRREQPQEGEKG